MILLPVAASLLAGPDRWRHVRRYVWLPGWLAFAVTAAAWAAAAYLRYPDVVDLWKSDYAGRVHQGYMREPAWYYLAHLPWNLFPWTFAALAGLWATRGRVLGQGRTPERFLWLWALVPVAFFSIPQGKHHHYLLHVMAPWAVLAAAGTVRLWDWLGTPWPLLRASVATFAVLPLGLWAAHASPTVLNDRYSADLAFLRQVRQAVPEQAPLLVMDCAGPLDPSWLLFYLERRAELLHNLSFLREGRHHDCEVYLVARPSQLTPIGRYGRADALLASRRSRGERSPGDRYTLYRVRLHAGLARHARPAYISPMQATGRAPGPELR
jgi:4-amino-4-deoxy-L-arabinose transferase-like glycosyltransferase